jgi:hypothetical protein
MIVHRRVDKIPQMFAILNHLYPLHAFAPNVKIHTSGLQDAPFKLKPGTIT